MSTVTNSTWVYVYSQNDYNNLIDIIFANDGLPLIESYVSAQSSFLEDLSSMDYSTFDALYHNFFAVFPTGPCQPGDIPCMLYELQGISASSIASFLTSQPAYEASSKNVIAYIEGQGGGSSLYTYIDASSYNLSDIVSWINSAEGNCNMFTDLLNWDKSALVAALTSYSDLESLLTQLYDDSNSGFLGIVVDQLEAVYRSTISSLYDLEDVLEHIATYFDQATADAVEEAITTNSDALTDFFRISEHPMYGSSRLGIARSDTAIYWYNVSGPEGEGEYQVSATESHRMIGKKHYELTNHLGNVLMVITDKKIEVEDGGSPGTIAYYKADIVSAQDYYPFGMIMTGRAFADTAYRYGFNGQERDDEIKGEGNAINFKYRIYDSRVGRFFSLDPLYRKYPHQGSYNFAQNKVIRYVELEGAEIYEPFHNNDPFSDVFDYAKAKLKHATMEYINNLVNYGAEQVNSMLQDVEVKVTANLHFRYSIGGRFSNEVLKRNTHIVSADIDLGSVSLVSFDGTWDLKSGELKGNFYYLNKDGVTIFTQGVTVSVGAAYQAGGGGGYNRNEERNKETGEKVVKDAISAGLGIYIFNLSGSVVEETSANTGEEKRAVTASLGILEGSAGLITVVEYGVKIESEFSYTTTSDEEDD